MNNIIYITPKSELMLARYYKFIKSISNLANEITETHHIIPVSMGGTNDSDNLIKLTPRQHYIAHWMLWKAYQTKEMTVAFFAMSNQNNQYQNRNYKVNSRIYEKLRLQFKTRISESTRNLWLNNEYRHKHEQTNQTKTTKLLRSKKAKELWQNPEYRQKLTESRKLAWSEGRVKRDHSKCGRKGDNNVSKRPEVREKNSGANHYSKREGFILPTCIHCGLTTTPTNIKRWHNDNCKIKV